MCELLVICLFVVHFLLILLLLFPFVFYVRVVSPTTHRESARRQAK